jgi:hypothetical protein
MLNPTAMLDGSDDVSLKVVVATEVVEVPRTSTVRVTTACLIIGVIIFSMGAALGLGAGIAIADDVVSDSETGANGTGAQGDLDGGKDVKVDLDVWKDGKGDLTSDRAACTAACNGVVTYSETGTQGNCCNNDKGVCGNPSCTMGCHMAWYAATKAECVAECRQARHQQARHQPGESQECLYTHPVSGTRFEFCRGQGECGCDVTAQCLIGKQFPCLLADGSGEVEDGCGAYQARGKLAGATLSSACEQGCELAGKVFADAAEDR